VLNQRPPFLVNGAALALLAAGCGRIGFDAGAKGAGGDGAVTGDSADGAMVDPLPEPPMTTVFLGACNTPVRIDMFADQPMAGPVSFASLYEGVVIAAPDGFLRAYPFGQGTVTGVPTVDDRPVRALGSSIYGALVLVIDSTLTASVMDANLVTLGAPYQLTTSLGLSDVDPRGIVGTVDGGFVLIGETNTTDPREFASVAFGPDGGVRGENSQPGIWFPALSRQRTGSSSIASSQAAPFTSCGWTTVDALGVLGATLNDFGDECTRVLIEPRDDHYLRAWVDQAGSGQLERRDPALAPLGPLSVFGSVTTQQFDLASAGDLAWLVWLDGTTIRTLWVDAAGLTNVGSTFAVPTFDGSLRALRIGGGVYAAWSVVSGGSREAWLARLCSM